MNRPDVPKHSSRYVTSRHSFLYIDYFQLNKACWNTLKIKKKETVLKWQKYSLNKQTSPKIKVNLVSSVTDVCNSLVVFFVIFFVLYKNYIIL